MARQIALFAIDQRPHVFHPIGARVALVPDQTEAAACFKHTMNFPQRDSVGEPVKRLP